MYSLLRSLLGDFDFDELQEGHSYMGPILFCLFVVLAVFVVLNMLIAIISDAYQESQEQYAHDEPIHVLTEMGKYIRQGCSGMLCGKKEPAPAKVG
jgi:hypothetical protein